MNEWVLPELQMCIIYIDFGQVKEIKSEILWVKRYMSLGYNKKKQHSNLMCLAQVLTKWVRTAQTLTACKNELKNATWCIWPIQMTKTSL